MGAISIPTGAPTYLGQVTDASGPIEIINTGAVPVWVSDNAGVSSGMIGAIQIPGQTSASWSRKGSVYAVADSSAAAPVSCIVSSTPSGWTPGQTIVAAPLSAGQQVQAANAGTVFFTAGGSKVFVPENSISGDFSIALGYVVLGGWTEGATPGATLYLHGIGSGIAVAQILLPFYQSASTAPRQPGTVAVDLRGYSISADLGLEAFLQTVGGETLIRASASCGWSIVNKA